MKEMDKSNDYSSGLEQGVKWKADSNALTEEDHEEGYTNVFLFHFNATLKRDIFLKCRRAVHEMC